jgi:rhodanese-related sulfurtransferase
LRLTAEELDARRAAGESIAVVDVRSRREYEAGHVPGALHMPFWRALFAPVPAAATLVLYCGHGPRAGLAQTILRLRGVGHTCLLGGHWTGWRRAGRPEERG